jgi:putative tryptophan/tyrosine transport system substrate-binding protein
MKRREFMALLGGAAVGWPLGARAQQAVTPVIGICGPARSRQHYLAWNPFGRRCANCVSSKAKTSLLSFAMLEGGLQQVPDLAAELILDRV